MIKSQIAGVAARALLQFGSGFAISHFLDASHASTLALVAGQVIAAGCVAAGSVAWSLAEKLWVSKWVKLAQKTLGYEETGHQRDLVAAAEKEQGQQ